MKFWYIVIRDDKGLIEVLEKYEIEQEAKEQLKIMNEEMPRNGAFIINAENL